jgi:hypothetical protein
MVVLSISSEKVALTLAVGATSIAFAWGMVLVTLDGVVSGSLGYQSASPAWDSEVKTLSENVPIDLEQRRISQRMDLPTLTVLKADAPYQSGYHNQEGRLL